MMTTSSERRLHPVSVVFDMGRSLPRVLVPLLVLLFTGRTQEGLALLLLLLVGGLAALGVILAVVGYLRFSYRYDATELVIRSGILTRNARSIPYVRIQNLDAAQNPLHRLFDVAVVHVQTGGGAEPEASLRVLPTAALREMRARVLAAGGRAGAAPASGATAAPVSTEGAPLPMDQPQAATLLKLRPGDLILAGFIENRGMVLIAGTLALVEQTGVSRRLIERLFQEEDATVGRLLTGWLGGAEVPVLLGTLYIAAALLALLLFIRLLSTVWAVVRLYDFRLDLVGDELHTEYGLFTRVSATIPLRRVQTVIVHDGLLHRLLHRRAVLVETAGGAAVEAGARQREPIAPILRVEQLPALLDTVQPGLDTAALEWRPVHPRAFGRMLRGSLLWPLALSALAFLLVQEWAIAVFLVLLVRAVVRARLRAKHLAWSLTRDSIAVRDGALTRATRVARFNRVQVVAVDRNPFDLRTDMAHVRADTAGARSGVVVPYLPQETAAALQHDLSVRTEATAFTW